MLLVMKNEIGTTLRRKAFIIMAIGLPLVLGLVALIVGSVNQNAIETAAEAGELPEETEEVVEGYVDEGGLIETLPADIPPGCLVAYPDEATAQAALEAEEIAGYYLIAPDYVESGGVTYVQLQFSPMTGDVEAGIIEWVLAVNLLGDEERAERVWNPLEVFVTSLAPEEEVIEETWITEMFPTLLSIVLYMVILMPAGLLVTAVTDEKKNQVIEILMSSVTPLQLLGGKIVALGLLGLLQVALWFGVLYGVVSLGGEPLRIPAGFEVPAPLLAWGIVYALLGYAMYGTQMAGLGALAPDMKDSRSATIVVLSPLILVYVFNAAIVALPDAPVALALSLFPLTSPIAMVTRMAATTVPLWQTALAAVLQLLTAILILRLVARLFRAQHLLSGQPFSLKLYVQTLLKG
jgi:ABC-2 type transport system permease protein